MVIVINYSVALIAKGLVQITFELYVLLILVTFLPSLNRYFGLKFSKAIF